MDDPVDVCYAESPSHASRSRRDGTPCPAPSEQPDTRAVSLPLRYPPRAHRGTVPPPSPGTAHRRMRRPRRRGRSTSTRSRWGRRPCPPRARSTARRATGRHQPVADPGLARRRRAHATARGRRDEAPHEAHAEAGGTDQNPACGARARPARSISHPGPLSFDGWLRHSDRGGSPLTDPFGPGSVPSAMVETYWPGARARIARAGTPGGIDF